jgi:F-type H+-transporting ATPase subunit epsilon
MAFKCVVVTPEQQLIDQSLSQAIIPAVDGQLGILTDRAPLLARLDVGPLRLDAAEGGTKIFLIEGGVAQMKDNNLTILTHAAIPAESVNAETAQAELAEATARVATDKATTERREKDLKRARAKIAMAKG